MKTLKIKGFSFDYSNGCLHHPGGVNTSWFVFRDGKWTPQDWAEDFTFSFSEDLVSAINETAISN